MITRVDWISFTFTMPANGVTDDRLVLQDALHSLHLLDPGLLEALDLNNAAISPKSRAPYKQRWTSDDNGVALYTHANLNHGTCEISGRTCERLHRDDLINPILELAINRLTRLDIACDMLTGTRPSEFAEKRLAGRYRSGGHQFSDDGETIYVGSKTSNRYARVYRYNPPHDRSHLLRSEFVIRKEDARLTAQAILNDGIDKVALSLGLAFGWQHPDWNSDESTPAELHAWRPERHKGSTVFWLNDTIAPLIARLHNEGTIDVYEYLTTHVIPRIITNSDQ